MTKSQWISAAATLVTTVDLIAARLLPLADALPPWVARWLPVVIAVAGVLTTALNQSLSPNHISLPREQAAAVAAEVPATVLATAAPALLRQVDSVRP